LVHNSIKYFTPSQLNAKLQKMGTKPKLYTTREVAEALGITRATLQTWIATGQIKAPRLERPGMGVRLWSQADVEGVRAYKKEFFRKGRGAAPSGERRAAVKFKETVWWLNARKRELTDGSRVFCFHPVGRYLPGKRMEITPIEWKERKSNQDEVVTDPAKLNDLNMIFRFIHGRAIQG
jgi:excisionase family DNA binding protein